MEWKLRKSKHGVALVYQVKRRRSCVRVRHLPLQSPNRLAAMLHELGRLVEMHELGLAVDAGYRIHANAAGQTPAAHKETI